jgi:hypothetical protein
MPTTMLERVTAQALALSPEEQDQLVLRLTQDADLHPDWDAEIARRVAAMDAGRAEFIPADEALAGLHARVMAARR